MSQNFKLEIICNDNKFLVSFSPNGDIQRFFDHNSIPLTGKHFLSYSKYYLNGIFNDGHFVEGDGHIFYNLTNPKLYKGKWKECRFWRGEFLTE